jgi:hypothetical protein
MQNEGDDMSFMNLLSTLGPLKGMFRKENDEDLKVLEQAISLLRLSTLYCLNRKLAPKFGPDTANALAVAVVSVMILEPPKDDSLAAFHERHRKEIEAEASEVRKHEELSGPSGCASYLYSAEILYSAMVKVCRLHGAARTEKSTRALEEQANKLGIVVPTVQEICGSNDRARCIEAIHSFAKAFYYTNTWAAPIPPIAEIPLPTIPPGYDFLSDVLLHDSPVLTGMADAKEAAVPALRDERDAALTGNSDIT